MTPLSPRVGIVVLNYNGKNCLVSCLTSLVALRYDNFFVTVVDNNSTDGSLLEAQKMFPQFTYVPIKENKGFAGGMNVGITETLKEGAEWVWLFNNDAIAEQESLSEILQVAADEPRENIGALSPLIIDKTTKAIWFGKGKINFWRMRAVHITPRTEELKQRKFTSEFLTGCALFIPAFSFQRVGLLDERFFLYYEDADFCLRLKKAGLSLLVVPSARVQHTERSATNPQKVYFLVLSGLLFFQKHADFWYRVYLRIYVTIRRIKNKISIWQGRDEARIVDQAYQDFYHGH